MKQYVCELSDLRKVLAHFLKNCAMSFCITYCDQLFGLVLKAFVLYTFIRSACTSSALNETLKYYCYGLPGTSRNCDLIMLPSPA